MKKLTVNLVLEVLCATILLGTLFYLSCIYNRIPEIIPIHYDLQGDADDYGNKNVVWILVVFEVFTYAVLSLVQLNPKSCNYPVQVTETNKKRLFFLGKRLLLCMKLCTVILFSYLAICVMGAFNLNSWILYGTIALTLLLPVVFIAKMMKCKD